MLYQRVKGMRMIDDLTILYTYSYYIHIMIHFKLAYNITLRLFVCIIKIKTAFNLLH